MENADTVFDEVSDDDIFDINIEPYLPELLETLNKNKIKYTNATDDSSLPLIIDYPTSKGTVALTVVTADEAKMLISSAFYKYKLLENYSGLYSPKEKLIECIVKSSYSFPAKLLVKRYNLSLANESDPTIRLEISKVSRELAALNQDNSTKISLKIIGITITDNNPDKILEKYANSLFFQFELINESPLSLVRRRRVARFTPKQRSTKAQFPSIELEKGPMALYWHARDAAQLPMFQFLAYYQSVEYFFPRISRQAAHKKVQSLLKDPSFRATSDQDIEKIFNTIKLTHTGRLGDEKSQLQAVISECLLNKEIKDFIESDADRKAHFTDAKNNPTSSIRITLNDPQGIMGTTAARLYDIRCKVVHSKNEENDSQTEMLLPNSPESDLLRYDIELMRFVAQKVLIHTSTRLQ